MVADGPLRAPVVKSRYRERVRHNILRLSEAATVPMAFTEWFSTGKTRDHEEPIEVCGLCGKDGIRYDYEIRNRDNNNVLWVGSKCILGFGIEVQDENGRRLDKRGAQRRLNSLRREKQYESSVKALERVTKKEGNLRTWEILRNALDYYREHRYLTPDFAFVVLWRLKVYHIEHKPKCFDVSLKRKSDRIELRKMPTSHVHMRWPALTPGQRQLAVSLGHCTPNDPSAGRSRGCDGNH